MFNSKYFVVYFCKLNTATNVHNLFLLEHGIKKPTFLIRFINIISNDIVINSDYLGIRLIEKQNKDTFTDVITGKILPYNYSLNVLEHSSNEEKIYFENYVFLNFVQKLKFYNSSLEKKIQYVNNLNNLIYGKENHVQRMKDILNSL